MSPRIDPAVLKQQVDALLKTLADINVGGDEMALGEAPASARAAAVPALDMAAAQAAPQSVAAAVPRRTAGRSTSWSHSGPIRKACGPLRPSPRNGFWPSTARSFRTTAAPLPFPC